MKTYEFGVIYIREEDKFQMKKIDSAFDCIPDETNFSKFGARKNIKIIKYAIKIQKII